MVPRFLRQLVKKYIESKGYVIYQPAPYDATLLDKAIQFNLSDRPVRDNRDDMNVMVLFDKPAGITVTTEALEDVLDVDAYKGKRVLEVGPKTGIHSKWISENIQPSEFVLLEIPDLENVVAPWAKELTCNHHWIFGNIINSEELIAAGPFDLVIFLGVFYHNVEHIKILNILNKITKQGGDMLFQTTTVELPQPVIQLRHRLIQMKDGTVEGRAKAYPSLEGLKMMFAWTGWNEVTQFTNYRPKSSERLFLCQKTGEPLSQYQGGAVGGSSL